MNNKRRTLFIALLSIFTTAGLFAACKTVQNITEVPKDKDYGYQNPDNTSVAEPDAGFTIDGKADEEAYKNSTWVNLSNKRGNNTVDLAMTSHFGEKGMYFVYDVTESTPIYVNPSRASYINSGIEMYFAPKGVTNMSSDHVYEIDLEADGSLTFKKRSGGTWGNEEGDVSGWIDVGTTKDIMAQLASTPKGGEINSGDCYGYTLEFFIPWDYVEWLGMNPETMKDEYVSVSPVHITSYNYEGTNHSIDRYWYSFGSQLGGDGWGDVDQYFHFDKNGVADTVPVTLGTGTHCTVSGPSAAVKGLPVNVTVTPEQGYAVTSLKCNDTECIKVASYNKDGSVTYTVTADDGLNFSAAAEAVTDGNKNLTGKITVKKAGGDSISGVSASYKGETGELPLSLNSDGTFALNDLPQGYYVITVEKKGYGRIDRGIYLNRNIETEIVLEYGTFDIMEGTCWDISGANDGYLIKKGGRGAILSKDFYSTFYVEANFRYDAALAAQSSVDEYYQQRTGFRIKFSNGKYWHPDVMCEGGEFKVTYGNILKPDSIFDWNTVHVMNAKQIAKYKSEEGIKLGILRVGTTAYIYLDGEFIAETDLGDEGIRADETAQIGFEGYVNNSESWRIDYKIVDEDADVITLGEVKEEGATVALDGLYKVGGNVVLVLNKQNATDVLLSLVVNGVEMSANVEHEEDADVLTITANNDRVLNVEAVYGEPQEITAHITVAPEWKANGIEFKFTYVSDDTNVKTATVADNGMTVENMLQGLYKVQANVFGATIDLGYYSVVSEDEKLLEVENVFLDGKSLDPSVINLSTGSFVYHSSIDEDYSIKINKAGDAFLAAKLSIGQADKAKLLKGGEVSFGMYMTVADSNGRETTHYTDFWIKTIDGSDYISIRTGFGWFEDFCKPFTTQVDSNKYSKALFGDGLYVVLRYKAETGVMETYFGTSDFNVAYLRDWNDADHLFPANGTVKQLGFRDSLTWGGTSVAVNVDGYRYGTTLHEALGIAGKTVTVTSDIENGTVSFDKTTYTAGDTVKCTIQASEGYYVNRIIVNGSDVTEMLDVNTLTLKDFTSAVLDIEVETKQSQNLAEVTITVDDVWHADGLAVTLKRDGFDDIAGTVKNGELVLKNVQQGIWIASMDIFGAPVSIQLTVTGDTTLDLGKAFANALQAKGNVNIADGTLTWHGNVKEDLGIKTNVSGDAWIASKITLGEAGKTKFLSGAEISFGIYMNVKGADGQEKLNWVQFWIKHEVKDNGESFLDLRTNFGWDEFLTRSLKTDIDSNKYIKALFGDGLYFVSRYDSKTGGMETYLGEHDYDVTYLRNWNDQNNLLPKDGALTAFGFRSDWWGNSDVTVDVSGFNYGSTLAEALGIADQKIQITGAGQQANGTVEVTENAMRGDTVEIKLTPDENYKILSLKVNGSPVDISTLKDGTYTLNGYLGATIAIEAEFEEMQKVSATVSVTGKKLGVNGNALDGLTVTLSGANYTATETVTGGSVTFTDVVVEGNYTLSAEGFLPKTGITVTEDGIAGAITLEYDTFTRYGSERPLISANQNVGKIGSKDNDEFIYTNDTFDKVAFSVYLKGDNTNGGNQGIAIRFGDGKVARVRIEGTQKVQFDHSGDLDWLTGKPADGSNWQDLIFFTGDNAHYLDDYKNGTLKLTCVRDGAKISVYLNGKPIGDRTFTGANYATDKVNVGVYYSFVGDKDAHEYMWNVELTEKTDGFAVTDTTEDTNGTVTFSSATASIGDKVTVTLTPNDGYIVKSLSVDGKDVTGSIAYDKENNTLVGTYDFYVSADAVVKATFEEARYVDVQSAVVVTKYGETDPIAMDLNGKAIKLSGVMTEYEIMVTDGKITQSNLLAGVYTVTADGFAAHKITIPAKGAYSADIKLPYLIFTEDPASADLSKISEGKVTATGNGNLGLSTKELYTDFTAEAHFDVPDYTSRRYSIALIFADGKDFRVDLAVLDGGKDNILQETNWGNSMMFNWQWVNFPEGYFASGEKSYTEAEVRSEFMEKGLTYKLERDGAEVKLYINGVLMKTYTLSTAYASQSAQLRFIMDSNGTDGTKGFTFNISTGA